MSVHRSSFRPRTGRLAAAVLAATVSMAAGCGVWPTPTAPEPVVVGVDVNLTDRGPGAAYDNALRLVVEQVNERALAGAGRRVELRVLDNRGDRALSAQNLASLAADPQVVAVVTAGCGACVVEAAGSLALPVIALTGEEAVAAPAVQRRWVFRLGPNAVDDADALAATMAGDGVSTVAVIAAGDAYGQDGARWFAAAAARDGLEVTAMVEVPATADQATVTELAASVLDRRRRTSTRDTDGPDAVLLWLPAPQAATVAQGLRAAGYRGRFYADMVAADELATPEWLAGTRLVATPTAVAAERIAASPAAAARQEWVLAYVSRYGGYQLHSTWAADALLVLADAIDRAGSTDRAEIRDHLEYTRIDGITGPIRFTAEQHSGLAGGLVILTAIGDRWQ
ncbi:MAG: ABC transporter substrate-binding protein [Micromonosporaceae bacterium]|nr:ABC transporter substrate-binding protein [Micromonosporaceae bacterium]